MLQAICIYILQGLIVLGFLFLWYVFLYFSNDGDFFMTTVIFIIAIVVIFLIFGATGAIYKIIDYLKSIWIKYNI